MDDKAEQWQNEQTLAVCVDSLTQAFQDDPALTWLLGGNAEDRVARLKVFFPSVQHHAHRLGLVFTAQDQAGVSLWRAPGASQSSTYEMLPSAPALLRVFGFSLGRALKLNDAIHARHPASDDFYHLQYVGVRPAAQGKGLGRTVIQAGLQIADAAEKCVVLETATPSNVSIYQRMGFEVTEEWQLNDDAPMFWTMERPPQR